MNDMDRELPRHSPGDLVTQPSVTPLRLRSFINLRMALTIVAVISLTNWNWPTIYELNAGMQAGQATYLFYTRPQFDSNTPTTALIGGFPKRYFYAVNLHSETPEHRQWFSLTALLIDLILCGNVMGLLLYKARQVRMPSSRKIGLLDLIIVTSLLAMFTAWSAERKAVFQFNENWARSTDSVAKYGTTRIWIGKNLVTSWPLPTSWFNYAYIDAEKTVECQPSQTYQSILKTVKNPLVERICVNGSETNTPYSISEDNISRPSALQNTGVQRITKQEPSFPLLRTLELSNCLVDAELLNWIKLHKSLRALRFVHCDIKEFPQDFFRSLPKLTQFENHSDDSGSELNFGSVSESENLQLLGVCYSTFNKIRNSLPGHPSLREIVVSANYESFSLPTSPANLKPSKGLAADLFGPVQVEFLSQPTDGTIVELSRLPNLEMISLSYFDDFSLTLDSLPRVRRVISWSPDHEFGATVEDDSWIGCLNSKITNCRRLEWKADLQFLPNSKHIVETIRQADHLVLRSASSLQYQTVALQSDSQSETERINQIEKLIIEFLDRLPARVEGGGLEINVPQIHHVTPSIPNGLQEITLTWQRVYGDDIESDSNVSDKYFQKPEDGWLPLSSEQLASVEAFDTNAPLTEVCVQRILDDAPYLRTISANLDAPQLIIRDHPNITDVCFYSINGEMRRPSCLLGYNLSNDPSLFDVERRPCQLQFLNCPNLREIWGAVMPEGMMELSNVPSLAYFSPIEYGYDEDFAISISGPTQLDSAVFEYGKLCGTLEENCRGWNMLEDVELKGNFTNNDICNFVSQYRTTLKNVTLRDKRYDPALARDLKSSCMAKVRWIDCQIDAANFAKLHSIGSFEGHWFTSVVMPTQEDLSAIDLKYGSKIQTAKFVIGRYSIDDDAAQWIADHVDTHELDVSQFDGDIELLLPCLSDDNCRLHVCPIQMSESGMSNAMKKYPKLRITVANNPDNAAGPNSLSSLRAMLLNSISDEADESNTSSTED